MWRLLGRLWAGQKHGAVHRQSDVNEFGLEYGSLNLPAMRQKIQSDESVSGHDVIVRLVGFLQDTHSKSPQERRCTGTFDTDKEDCR